MTTRIWANGSHEGDIESWLNHWAPVVVEIESPVCAGSPSVIAATREVMRAEVRVCEKVLRDDYAETGTPVDEAVITRSARVRALGLHPRS
jgi:hypothetical protein